MFTTQFSCVTQGKLPNLQGLCFLIQNMPTSLMGGLKVKINGKKKKTFACEAASQSAAQTTARQQLI